MPPKKISNKSTKVEPIIKKTTASPSPKSIAVQKSVAQKSEKKEKSIQAKASPLVLTPKIQTAEGWKRARLQAEKKQAKPKV